jgi:transcription elongation GreA/GreB family factor
MSRAFVKELDDTPELPDRPLSPYPNLVTAAGLAQIDAELARWRDAYGEAQRNGDRAGLASAARELRYWTARRGSAQLTEPGGDPSAVRFGSAVTLTRPDGRRQTFRIVGEDEADPAAGTLSHASPLARALMGKAAGDTAAAPGGEVEIEAVA